MKKKTKCKKGHDVFLWNLKNVGSVYDSFYTWVSCNVVKHEVQNKVLSFQLDFINIGR